MKENQPFEHSVLVVDDNIEITQAISLLLGREFNVYAANTVADTKKQLRLMEYSVIILDFDLDEEHEDGVTLSNLVKQYNPFSHIILLTGNLEYNTIKRALNEGKIDYFLNKPIVSADLHDRVNQAITAYKERVKVTEILHSPNNLEKIQYFITDILAQNQQHKTDVELIGLFIAQDSIPIYSKINQNFIDGSLDSQLHANDLTTLFSSFLSALVTLGQEAFSDKDSKVMNGFNLQNHYFIFRFQGNFQYTYHIHSIEDVEISKLYKLLDDLHSSVEKRITELKPKRYIVLSDKTLDKLVSSYTLIFDH